MANRERRLMSLDFLFYDDRVDDARYSSSRTLLEHDIVIWESGNLLDEYAKSDPHLDSPCLSDGASAQFARDLARRNREFHEFLSLGRLLIVLLPEPMTFYVATGKKRNDGTKAKPRMTRLLETRNTQVAVPLSPQLEKGTGTSIQIVGDPAFASFWRAVGEQFQYHAFITLPESIPLLKVSGTDRIVGAVSQANGGTVLFLPKLNIEEPDTEQGANETEDDYWERWEKENQELQKKNDEVVIDALLEYARETQDASTEPLPAWTERLILPEEEGAKEAADKSADQAERALRQVEDARLDLLAIQSHKKLITLGGKSLEKAVARALEELGCTVERGEPGRTDQILRWKSKVAVVEVKGTVKSASEANATQLEKWVTEYSLMHGSQPKGILVANAFKNLPLDERTDPVFPSQMLPYAESRGHCLLTTSQLLTATVTATSKKKRADFLDALFSTTGVLTGYAWTDEIQVVTESQDADSD
jgi:hypothetical protein